MPKKILIVDDSESIREVVSFTLENEGFDVLIANDGTDALKFLDGREIDMIITDLHMPEMDGITLIKHVRAMDAYQRIPILFLTTDGLLNPLCRQNSLRHYKKFSGDGR